MPVVLASSGQVELRGEELQGPLGLYSRILSLGAKIKQMKAQNKCTNFHVGKGGQVILDPEILAKDSFFFRGQEENEVIVSRVEHGLTGEF